MGLIGAYAFTSLISSYRLLWIGGRFGGHKTSLAYHLAQGFLDSGYRLLSNNQCVWRDKIENVDLCDEHNKLHAVVVLDEGGLAFKSSKQIEMIASYARKMDVIYIIPSFWPPTRAAQVLTCQPVFNFKSAGLPLVFYKWRVRLGNFEDKGLFAWWRPSEVYGIYSTQDPGDTSTEIVEYLIKKTEEYRMRYGYSNELPKMEVTSEDIMADVSQDFADAVERIASIPIRRRGRK